MTRAESLMVGLLGRIAFQPDELRAAIVRNKKDPNAYIRGYNACDGEKSVGDIAKVIGVTAGTLVPILQQWERLGIIYEVESDRKGKYCKHLYHLED